MRRRFLLACVMVPIAALAEDGTVLAEYYTSSGSLPPEYAWETTVVIRDNGQLMLRHCRGYETGGPACKDRKAMIAASDLEAIRAAARASGLAESPARPSEYPTVGGSMTGGAVYLDGVKVQLIADPQEADAARVSAVLVAVQAAIPARFNRFLDAD